MKDIGFKVGLATPAASYHAEKDIRSIVHGGDYISVGPIDSLKWLSNQLNGKFELAAP